MFKEAKYVVAELRPGTEKTTKREYQAKENVKALTAKQGAYNAYAKTMRGTKKEIAKNRKAVEKRYGVQPPGTTIV